MRYIQNPLTGKLVPADQYVRPGMNAPAVHGEIEPFQSHVSGEVIDSRRALREHNKRHGVVSHAEFGNEGEKARKAREDFYEGRSYDTERRVDAVKFAYELEADKRSQADKKQMIENYQKLNR